MILVFEDKLGITAGYEQAWSALLLNAKLPESSVLRRSIWKTADLRSIPLLIKKGNRKSPGFNPDEEVQSRVHAWFRATVTALKPEVLVVMDVALLGIFESSWDIATIDNMRGGVYDYFGIPTVIITPISALHTQKKPKDISAMNAGAESKAEFEEDEDRDPEEFFIEPYTIPFGRIVLHFDLDKTQRIWTRLRNARQDSGR